uniref:Uncharacterized protein n=1 Tax=Candidatus Kentrum sp. SD TaxID=2126332 RepID=A0A451BR84_9GAMM|nr:MAG: hypothetical protein BECKSD772D_GA0070982_11587 [Candidatus Kentron sp. SD]
MKPVFSRQGPRQKIQSKYSAVTGRKQKSSIPLIILAYRENKKPWGISACTETRTPVGPGAKR